MTKLIAVTRNFDGVANEVSQTENSLQDAIKIAWRRRMSPNAGAKAAQKAAQPPNALERLEAVLAVGAPDDADLPR